MLDSVWKRWLLAGGAAVLVAAAITTLLSGTSHQAKKKGADAVATWKARTGIDLAALPSLHPSLPDSEGRVVSTQFFGRRDCASAADRRRGTHRQATVGTVRRSTLSGKLFARRFASTRPR